MKNFNYIWNMKSDYPKIKNSYKVFSCFSGGGGSTMGYKLSGYDVIGCLEIDEKMMEIYKINHDPKFCFRESIVDFKNKDNLPEELYNLDILDGSPPCSSFSISGNREKDWGKSKKFSEGQINQVLDTLFFDFIALGKKLQPKIIIAENVKGLLIGNAKKYTKKILIDFDKAGYVVKLILLNAVYMGVPQRRERVFFIALRKDLSDLFLVQNGFFNKKLKINLDFVEEEICFNEFDEKESKKESWCTSKNEIKLWKETLPGKNFSAVHPKGHYFNHIRIAENRVLPTLTAQSQRRIYHWKYPRYLSKIELIKGSSYPSDYNFINKGVGYVVGMSVPPVMMANISKRVQIEWLDKMKVNIVIRKD